MRLLRSRKLRTVPLILTLTGLSSFMSSTDLKKSLRSLVKPNATNRSLLELCSTRDYVKINLKSHLMELNTQSPLPLTWIIGIAACSWLLKCGLNSTVMRWTTWSVLPPTRITRRNLLSALRSGTRSMKSIESHITLSFWIFRRRLLYLWLTYLKVTSTSSAWINLSKRESHALTSATRL